MSGHWLGMAFKLGLLWIVAAVAQLLQSTLFGVLASFDT